MFLFNWIYRGISGPLLVVNSRVYIFSNCLICLLVLGLWNVDSFRPCFVSNFVGFDSLKIPWSRYKGSRAQIKIPMNRNLSFDIAQKVRGCRIWRVKYFYTVPDRVRYEHDVIVIVKLNQSLQWWEWHLRIIICWSK